jgi:hypothetical protein
LIAQAQRPSPLNAVIRRRARAGAISRWRLEMQNEFRQFDHDSMTDLILHLNYTAREGGGALRDAAMQHLQAGINALVTGEDAPGLLQAFSARHEFPTEFHRFLHPAGEPGQQILTLNLAQKGTYKDLQSIPPGGSWEESFWVRTKGY